MAEANEKNGLTDKEIIEDNEKRFEFFVYLPKVITIILGILVFILGCVGSMDGNGGTTLLIWLGGAVFCWLTYALLKLAFSYQILHIYYLKQLVKQQEDKEEEKKEVQEKQNEMPEKTVE